MTESKSIAITDPDLLHDIEELRRWGRELKIIRKIWIFGSRITGQSHSGSELDVAVEHDKIPGDTNQKITWMGEAGRWRKMLNDRLKLELDLWPYRGPQDPPRIHAGLKAGSLLIYDRNMVEDKEGNRD